MDDLGKSINGLIEPVIEAMNEDKHLAASSLLGGRRQSGDKRLFIEMVRRNGYKALPRIAWKRGGPLYLANLSCCVGWNGNSNRPIRHVFCLLALEHFTRIICCALPCCSDKHRDKRCPFCVGLCDRNQCALR